MRTKQPYIKDYQVISLLMKIRHHCRGVFVCLMTLIFALKKWYMIYRYLCNQTLTSALFHNAVYAGDINHLQTQTNGSLSLWRQRDNGFVVFLCSNTDIIYIIWKISSMKWDLFCLCNYVNVLKHIWYFENYLIYSKKAKQTDQVNVFFGLIWCLLAVLKYLHASMNYIWMRSMSQYFLWKSKKKYSFFFNNDNLSYEFYEKVCCGTIR